MDLGAVEAARNYLKLKLSEVSENATARRDCGNRNATVAELKHARKLAEGMAGRKLPESSIDPKAHAEYYDMQMRIAAKYEADAQQLEGILELISDSTQVVLLREQNAELERAVEHAGYLADSVDHYLEERNKFDALEEVDVGDQDSLNDHFSALRDRVYEFRKRRAILSKVKGQSK